MTRRPVLQSVFVQLERCWCCQRRVPAILRGDHASLLLASERQPWQFMRHVDERHKYCSNSGHMS